MHTEEGTLCGYVPDEELSMAMVRGGINPVAVRDVLGSRENSVDMQLANRTAVIPENERQQVPDLVVWGWIPILSDRARSMAIRLGSEADEFWPCRFRTNPDERFFFHLPKNTVDIVDVEKSTFKLTLPLDPPIPMFIDTLVTRAMPDSVPPCFRARIPRTTQVFSELFVQSDFKVGWDQMGLRGAEFRQLSS
jgi:hypothetical protein